MFSKSKRFDNKPVGCGADAAYNPVVGDKLVGGVIPKEGRFTVTGQRSDTESVLSDKAASVHAFRTPQPVRRQAPTSISKSSAKLSSDCKSFQKELFEELLESKNVEIRNKDETIQEYETRLKSMNEELSNLKRDLAQQNNILDSTESDKVSIESDVKEIEYYRILSKQVDSLKYDRELLIRDLREFQLFGINGLSELQNQMRELDRINQNGEDLALVKKHHALALEANESIRNEYKTEMDALRFKHQETLISLEKNHKSEMDAYEKKNAQELEKIKLETNSKIADMEDQFSREFKRIEENSEEKLRIFEIQLEERYAESQAYEQKKRDQENTARDNQLKECQENANYEAAQSEFKIEELSALLHSANQKFATLSDLFLAIEKENEIGQIERAQEKAAWESNLKEREESAEAQIKQLNLSLRAKDDRHRELAELFVCIEKDNQNKQSEIEILHEKLTQLETASEQMRNLHFQETTELKTKLDKVTIEKMKFSVTLETTRQTVNVLMTRLRNSDQDVEKLKSSLEEAADAKVIVEAKLARVESDFSDFKIEYNRLLSSIVASKAALDESHQAIIDKNSQFNELFFVMQEEFTKEIEDLKRVIMTDVEKFKQCSIQELEVKLSGERERYSVVKAQCDEAFHKLGECDDLIATAHKQLEAKDQEMFELATENDRLAGTLAAVDQERNELHHETLRLNELFMQAVIEKNYTLSKYQEQEQRLMTVETTLEARDVDMRVLNKEISALKNELSESQIHLQNCDEETLKLQCANLEKDLEEISHKYADLLGHQNNKQKIKHVIDLKAHNITLKEENERLLISLQKQTAMIDKLKKEASMTDKLKSPKHSRKQILADKENMTSPLGKSPKALGSRTRELTPLKPLNQSFNN